jgi:hypothetical protein
VTSLRTAGSFAAYAALYVAVFGVALTQISDPVCHMESGSVSDPGGIGAPITWILGLVLAVFALVQLARARRERPLEPPRRLASFCAWATLPVVAFSFLDWFVTAALACGISLL